MEEYRRSEEAALCLCRSRKSIKQGAETGDVVLHEEVLSSREDLRVVQDV